VGRIGTGTRSSIGSGARCVKESGLCLRTGYFLTRMRTVWYPDAPSGSVGTSRAVCTTPRPSRARTFNVYSPGAVGVQSAAHNTQVNGPSGGLISAGRHVPPPSVLYSTALIPRSPPYATPPSPISPTVPERGATVNSDIVFTTASSLHPDASQYPRKS